MCARRLNRLPRQRVPNGWPNARRLERAVGRLISTRYETKKPCAEGARVPQLPDLPQDLKRQAGCPTRAMGRTGRWFKTDFQEVFLRVLHVQPNATAVPMTFLPLAPAVRRGEVPGDKSISHRFPDFWGAMCVGLNHHQPVC